MASPCLRSEHLLHDVVPFLPSPISLHPTIPLKSSSFPCFFFLLSPFPPFFAALSSRPHSTKLLDKSPKRGSFHWKNSSGRLALENEAVLSPSNVASIGSKHLLLPMFTSMRQGNEERNVNLKKAVEFDEETKKEKNVHKGKLNSEEDEFRFGLDMCSKAGDVLGAISLYEAAVKKGFRLRNYHYNVLLYLCSASAGSVYPGNSGSSDGNVSVQERSDILSKSQNLSEQRGFRSWNMQKLQLLDRHSDNFEVGIALAQKGLMPRMNDRKSEMIEVADKSSVHVGLSDDVRAFARRKGFEIFEKMCLEKVPLSEATMTSVARMAMSMGDGDMAFEILKHMRAMGLTPKLRSHGPSILTFSSCGSVDKAFEVERHMLEFGITPEEHELEALLRANVEARSGEKVYYLLHKLRTIVRQVSPSTADVIDAWFRTSTASRVGKRKWDNQAIKQAIENGGGGWHGLGWLGKGKWNAVRTHVDDEGVCLSCKEKLVTIDLDLIGTENFAKSVEAIVVKKEMNSNFEEFKRWLEYYGPFEAVIDAANVGLFKQRRFSLNKVNAVANGIRQILPSKKWPLIIVHNKRIFGGKMNQPSNKKLIEKWKNADAIYATPTGSNDDWYWLYAAIKCKCLVVTNDEMRDHIFQVLGNDFFAKWKERHQESESGHWHIPIAAEHEQRSNRTWMCVTRKSSHVVGAPSSTLLIDRPGNVDVLGENSDLDSEASKQFRLASSSKHPPKMIENRPQIFSAAGKFPRSRIMSAIEDAENSGGCVINFEI